MSDESSSRRQASQHGNVHARHSNGIGKWVAGAAVVALLAGGGYYAWSQRSHDPSTTEVADNSAFSAPTYDDAASKAAPLDKATGNAASADAVTGNAATDDKAYLAPASTAKATPSPKKAAKTKIAAADIPTETIGVSDTAVASTQSEELVVNAPHRPVWRYAPRPERLAEYYPAFALDRGREGEASLHCTVGQKGILSCDTISESPARAGFGAAAIRVARSFRHADLLSDGSSAVGTPVNLRVLFRMAEGERRG